jgi:ATP-binding cassette subfamily C protein
MMAMSKILDILGPQRSRKVGGLVLAMVVLAGLEAITLASFIPFLQLLSDPEHRTLRSDSLPAFFTQLNYLQQLQVSAAVLLGLFIVKNGLFALLNHFKFKFIYESQVEIASELVERYLRAPFSFHLETNSSTLIRTITEDVRIVFGFVLSPLMMLLAEFLVVAAVGALLLALDPLVATAASFVLVVSGGGFLLMVRRRLSELGELQQKEFGEMIRTSTEALGSVAEIQISGTAQHFEERFRTRSHSYANALRTYRFHVELTRPVLEVVAVGGMLVVVLLAVSLSADQSLVPLLGVFGLAAVRLAPSGTRIISALTSTRHFWPSVDVVHQVLDEPALPGSVGEPLTDEFESVQFENVTFGYGDGPHILHDISLRIDAGQSVAFVGGSGAGKSTMVKLLLGLLLPSEGRILMGSVDTRNHLQAWRGLFGYVPQSVRLLDETIRNNVAFGIPATEQDEGQLWKVIETARIASFVRTLPEGLDSTVGEFGDRISGGQRQRVGIARALYTDPKIVVFDEATSALDSETEQQINEALQDLRTSGFTTVIVAHRLSTVRRCDRIFVMDEGTLVAQGTYDELLRDSPEFQQLVSASTARIAS